MASLGPLVKAPTWGSAITAFRVLRTAFLLVYRDSPCFGYLGRPLGPPPAHGRRGGVVAPGHQPDLLGPSYPALVAARGLVGVGEASFGTLAPAYLRALLPLRRRSRALGLFYLALPVGTALGFLVGGLVGAHWGWRPAFLLGGLPGLAMAGLVYCLPQTPPETEEN